MNNAKLYIENELKDSLLLTVGFLQEVVYSAERDVMKSHMGKGLRRDATDRAGQALEWFDTLLIQSRELHEEALKALERGEEFVIPPTFIARLSSLKSMSTDMVYAFCRKDTSDANPFTYRVKSLPFEELCEHYKLDPVTHESDL